MHPQSQNIHAVAQSSGDPEKDPAVIRWTMIGIAAAFLSLFLVLPVAAVLVQAFEKGLLPYVKALAEPDTLSALRLTLVVVAVAVTLNLL
jgi:sulfate transport system permease protein